MYVDANNLYGFSLCAGLSCGDYKWLNKAQIDAIKSYSGTDKVGYVLEVDLEYPKHLHNLHKSYPLCAETKIITHEMLSPYSKKMYKKLYNSKKFSSTKLVTTLEDKLNYVCLGDNLKFYLEQGLILKKIHRVLSFTKTEAIAE